MNLIPGKLYHNPKQSLGIFFKNNIGSIFLKEIKRRHLMIFIEEFIYDYNKYYSFLDKDGDLLAVEEWELSCFELKKEKI